MGRAEIHPRISMPGLSPIKDANWNWTYYLFIDVIMLYMPGWP